MTMPQTALRVLLIDDSEDERWLLEDDLRQAGFDPELKRIDNAAAMRRALENEHWDLLMVDWIMPQFSGASALEIYLEHQLDLPFIVLSNQVEETVAEAAMEQGAHDFIAKGNRTRMIPAIRRELLMAERRRQQRQLDDRNRLILDTAGEGVFGLDAQGHHTFVNPAAAQMLGWSVEDLLGRHSHHTWHHHKPDGEPYPDDTCPIHAVIKGGAPVHGEEFFVRRNGSFFPVEFDASPIIEKETITGAVVTFRDVTQRKHQEEMLQRTNRALNTLSQCNQTLVRATNKGELTADICEHLVDHGGYTIAWVALFDHAGSLHLSHWSHRLDESQWEHYRQGWQQEIGTLEAINFTANHAELTIDPPAIPGSQLALPLTDSEGTLGLLGVCANNHNDFLPSERELLAELASDITFGLRGLNTRKERDHALAALDTALLQTINAISLTLEKRDPYTAGHQHRVAELAEAIGDAMGLEANRIKGLRLGALLHDIGKIAIPAEILSRPGRLSANEYRLIQEHPATGHQILKDVDFPWPITTMILQHHEALDGSGYPNGLSSDEILLESRILAVSDVVEAMTSHRPYRPALPAESALAEIRQGAASGRFDPAVVHACESVLTTETAIPDADDDCML